MKKKLLAMAVGLGLSLAMLTGCGKPTVESLIEGLQKNEVESQTAAVSVDFSVSMEAMDEEVSLGFKGDLDVESAGLTGDESVHHITGKMTVSTNDESEKVNLDVYMDMGEEKVYGYNEDEDAWYYQEIDGSDGLDQETIDAVNQAVYDVLIENGELAEETVKVGDVECYVVTATIDGDGFKTIFDAMGDILSDAMEEAGADVNFEDYLDYFTMNVSYSISKKDGYLMAATIDLSETDFQGIMDEVLKAMGGEGLELTAEIKAFEVIAEYSNINETEVEIPDDVVDDAVESDDVMDIAEVGEAIGENEPVVDEPVIEEPPVDEPVVDEPVEEESWMHGNYYDFVDVYGNSLGPVYVPSDFSLDTVYSTQDRVYMDYYTGEYMTIFNEGMYPEYLLLEGYSEDDIAEYGYTDYQYEGGLLTSTRFGDCYLIHQQYTSDGETYEEYVMLVDYGGDYIEVYFNYIDVSGWTTDQFNTLANEMFN